MTWFIWLTLAFADDSCRTITLPDITAVPEPAIIVLGERRGVAMDNLRAVKVLKALHKKTESPVTVAVDVVHHKYQHVFEQYSTGALDILQLEDALSWRTHTEVSFTPYRKLFATAVTGGTIHAVGTDLKPPPPEITPPTPGVYPSIVNSVVPDGELGFGLDAKISKTMAYWDYLVANRAANEWDGRGYLLIVTERARVEGGGGIPWQLVRQQDTPVYSFLLAWADPYCAKGDNVWAQNPLLSTLGITP